MSKCRVNPAVSLKKSTEFKENFERDTLWWTNIALENGYL